MRKAIPVPISLTERGISWLSDLQTSLTITDEDDKPIRPGRGKTVEAALAFVRKQIEQAPDDIKDYLKKWLL